MVEAKGQGGGDQLSYLMIGGGPGAFIGSVHRAAIGLLGQAELVGGCFSQSLEKSRVQGQQWNVDPSRVYENYTDLLNDEARRPDRPDFVVIVTPNDCQNPNQLIFHPKGRPSQILTRGPSYLHPHAGRYTRPPAGHPEGLFEAFANLYDGFISTIRTRRVGLDPGEYDIFPNVYDGARGVKFISDLINSNSRQNAWVDGTPPSL